MRKLNIIISLLIIGIVLSDDQIYIFDITYLQEFSVPNKGFPSNSYDLYFRLPCPSVNEDLAVTIKYHDEYDDYSIHACGYTNKPTDEELKKGTDSGRCDWLHEDTTKKGKGYTKFIYEVDSYYISEATYLVVKIHMSSEFKFLSVLVSPYKRSQKMIMKSIEYDKEVIIDSETLSNSESSFMFNTESKNGNKESMTIKLHKDDVNDFMVTLVGIKNLEDIQKISPSSENTRLFRAPSETKDDGEYKIYEYKYAQLTSETKYLYIMIVSIDSYELQYFSFTLNSGGLSGGVIALIVILVIIVLLVVAYFVLRKLGIISFNILTFFKK